MPLFADDFERADGSLGNDWSVRAGAAQITSGSVSMINNTFASAGPITAPGSAMAECVVTFPGSANVRMGPAVKGSTDGTQYYLGYFNYSGGVTTYGIYRMLNSAGTSLASQTEAVNLSGDHTVRLTYSGGSLVLYVDGVQKVTGSNATYAANALVGIGQYNSPATVKDFNGSGDGAPAMFLSPRTVGTEDGDQIITWYGTGVTYTPGSPGSPALSVDVGAINGQQITTTANGTFIYSPPTAAGTATVLDSVNGLSATISVVAGSFLGNTTPGQLSSSALDYIERSAAAEQTAIIANRTETFSGYGVNRTLSETVQTIITTLDTPTAPSQGSGSILGLILEIWAILNGRDGAEEGNTVLGNAFVAADRSDTILDRMSLAQTGGVYDDGTLMRAIAGTPGGSIQTVLDAIDALDLGGGVDLQPVLDAIAALRGDTVSTVAQLVTILGQIRTVNTWHLGNVKEWIEAVQGASTPTIANVRADIAALHDAPPTDLSGVLSAIAGNKAVTDAISAALVAYLVPEAATVQTILDAIDGIDTGGGSTYQGPPVWIDEAHATMGETVALVNGLDIEGPLHGVIVEITAHPPGAGVYGFGDMRSWGHAGAAAFRNDIDAYEWPISLGPQTQIITPRSMQTASGVRFRVGGGYEGTVTPWTLSGGSE